MSSAMLNAIKIEIRSLLISSPKGLSEEELSRDYSFFNSQCLLPYQIFGYSTRTEFLNSLTDILYRSLDGYIHPIVDQSTEHIYKLVQQQRTNKKKKPKSVRKMTPLLISGSQQMHPPVGAHKMAENKQGFISRLKPSPRFERINVTNEFLQSLLIHFRQRQK